MQGDNKLVEQLFSAMADLLEINGDNPFKIRAYRNATRVLHAFPTEASELLSRGEDLSHYPGIGKDLAKKIKEIIRTGHLQALDSLMKDVSPELIQLMKIAGLGGKRVAQLHKKLGIVSLDDLENAAKSHSIRSIRGFGERTEEAILKGIHLLKGYRRTAYSEIELDVNKLTHFLEHHNEITRLTVAGSFRRRLETVRDIDFLVTGNDASAIVNAFLSYNDIAEVTIHGEKKVSVILHNGIQVDLRLIDPESYGAALHYFTGSKAHNIAVRTLAVHQGLKINEYGIFRGETKIGGEYESDVYNILNLHYIEPELRENSGEIEAAENGTLPKLIATEDLRGDLHTHTTFTDGHATAEEMVIAARKKGYEYIAITDHSKRIAMAHGLNEYDLERQIDYLDRVASEIPGIKILKGIEVDILEDGSLDLADSVLSKLDIRVCSTHSYSNLTRQKQTDRIIRAMDNRYFNILAHPTGRLINKRAPFDLDMEKVMLAARQRGCILEVNCSPERMDLNGEHCRMAKNIGVMVCINTDAHSVRDLNDVRYGIGQARRGWIEPDNVLNTKSYGDLIKVLRR
ncbi:MAG TPA: DNA polymerase/3'-5' exonuclease PolX [Chitinispirillaceae bacterium]|nr:DNA polymerase/3'-5' exonuclease PolX [Chitinispirillaceae bacterium]